MKKLTQIILIAALSSQFSLAQDKMAKKTSFAVNIVHNSVAGFAPVFLGSVSLNDKVDLTFYSIFWTNPTFGSPASGGDLFLETGIGLGMKPVNGLFINPTIGVAHGKFLSGGETTRIAEGLVPNLLAIYNRGKFEFETYVAYYASIRNAGPITKDYFLNWIAPGVKLGGTFSFGAYYEIFTLTKLTDPETDPFGIYTWLGGYGKMSFDKGRSVRLALGKNFAKKSGASDEFFKISVFLPI